jgi:ketosteroid isomerase-like protein
VIVDLHYRARGRASGIEVASTPTHVWTFRHAKIVRFQTFPDRAHALEALDRIG